VISQVECGNFKSSVFLLSLSRKLNECNELMKLSLYPL
jgi:hypothetical protein